MNYFVALFVEIFLSKVRQMATVDRIEGLIGLFLVVHAKAGFFLDDCLFGTYGNLGLFLERNLCFFLLAFPFDDDCLHIRL